MAIRLKDQVNLSTGLRNGESVLGEHAVHGSYYGLWNTEAISGTTQQYLIISAGTDTYINGDNVYIRAGNNSTSNQLKVTTSGTTIGGNTVWHAGNDGASSGLDADLLDGQQSTAYFRDIGSISITTSNPFADSHSETKVAENGMRTLSYTGASAFMYTFNNGGSASVIQLGAHYNGSDYYLRTRTDSSNWQTWKKIWHNGNDGAGSGLDADTVDGIQGGSFLRSDADDSFSGNLTSGDNGWIKFYAAEQTDSNDGKIGSGVFDTV